MKTIGTFGNGDRLVQLSAEEWDGLGTATEIAFQEEDPIPEALRPIAARLFAAFHNSDLERRAVASVGALTPGDVAETDRDNRRDTPDRSKPPIPAGESYTWTPLTNICDGCGNRFRLSWEAFQSIAETEITTVLSDADPAPEIERKARALTLGDVADGAQWCLHCVQGDDAPGAEYVGGQSLTIEGERPIAAFVFESVPYFAYAKGGCFLGRAKQDEGYSLLSVAMLIDGSPDRDTLNPEEPTAYNVVDVTAIEGLDLDAVNVLLGATFTPGDFVGR